MLRKLLGLDTGDIVTGLEAHFRLGWLWGLALVAGAVLLAVYFYRSEKVLSRTVRVIMAGCYGIAVAVLLVLLLEPFLGLDIIRPVRRTILVLLDTSESMAIKDRRVERSDVEEAAIALAKAPLAGNAQSSRIDGLKDEMASATRLALAKGLLSHPQIKLLERLGESHELRSFCFDSVLAPASGKGEAAEWLRESKAGGKSTRVGSAIEEAVERYSGQPIAGVVVLSDFAWNEGADPIEVAKRMKDRGIPVYTVGLGLPTPPDVRVRRVIAPDVVFANDKVPVRVQIDSRGFDHRSVELGISLNGDIAGSRAVTLTGGSQFEEIMFTPRPVSGTANLEASIVPLAGEISEDNNRIRQKIRIIDEKIKVLYVEGMPRWEYRYLRWVLLRDQRLDVKFLMTQGDPTLPTASTMYLPKYPEEAAAAFKFDLVILGDVPASYFSQKQMELMEELVRKRGGSLLMIAGPMGAPSSYVNTPIDRILPVKTSDGQWVSVGDDVHPVVTRDGLAGTVASLAVPREKNAQVWSAVKPLTSIPQLGGAKAGATVLLTLSDTTDESKAFPLVAWQRYGSGKCMFVGTEDLWRLRFQEGDKYHARFWGQAIQFLTLSRLLGENKQITIETDRRLYSAGEQAQVFANVLNDAYEPVVAESYWVRIEKKNSAEEAAQLELKPVPGTAGLYTGSLVTKDDGSYTVLTAARDQSVAGAVEFDVVTTPPEQRETAMQIEVQYKTAELSGGRAFSIRNVNTLPDSISSVTTTRSIRQERDLWDLPVIFILIVVLFGSEWYLRRSENLI